MLGERQRIFAGLSVGIDVVLRKTQAEVSSRTFCAFSREFSPFTAAYSARWTASLSRRQFCPLHSWDRVGQARVCLANIPTVRDSPTQSLLSQTKR
jgi:hypothetical protein